MHSAVLAHQVDWDGWRAQARALALSGIPPEEVVWSVREAGDLFADRAPPPAPEGSFSVPRALVALAEDAIQDNDPERFALLYALVWRVHAGEKHLLEDATDRLVARIRSLAAAVRRDAHKMRAFVRFRTVESPEGTRHVAWFEPEHYTLEGNAPFFVRRFATMAWSILTPYRSAHWDGEALRLGPGASRAEVPDDDALEAYWRTYYESIFNPARLKVSAMLSEMPRKYWRNLPEAAAIPDLIRAAPSRAAGMVEQPVLTDPRPVRRSPARTKPAAVDAAPGLLAPADAAAADGPFVQPGTSATPETPLDVARQEAAQCRACPLWADATQVVFGEGPVDARMMLVGEQPGDQEDLAGHPFVGPAGQMLNQALEEAGVDRTQVYVTNAVKHFKFEPRGRRRIHAKPSTGEISACRFWLDLERRQVRPALTVLLGASAARSVLGRAVTIGRERGVPIPLPGPDGGNAQAFVTVHPSYLLRLPTEDAKQREYAAFVADLRKAASLLA